ncbi:MAG: amidase family protein [Burkholderiaceae bacterium]
MINHFSSATQMIKALRERNISATELLQLHLDRIHYVDKTINAVVVRDFERAATAANAVDGTATTPGEKTGVLSGLPMTIKESINIAGLGTCCGMETARNFVSAHDAPTVVRLRDAGAVLMGKTNIPVELADWQSNNPVYGRTNNPYDLSRSAGGSSGGSAAALAAGMTPLEVGSDIGGSVRVPAAFCGVFGHRPSETALAKSGQFPVPPTPIPAALLGVQGPMARTAIDLELGMSVLGGADIGEDTAWQLHLPPARHEKLADYRVASMVVPAWVPLAPAIRQAQATMIDRLQQLGCAVSKAQPDGFADWRNLHQLYLKILGAMLGARVPTPVREERIRLLLDVGDDESVWVAQGMQANVAQLFEWLAAREQARAAWRQFFQNFDVFIAPAVMRTAYPHLALEGSPFIAARQEQIQVDGKTVPYLSQIFYPGLCTLAGQPATAVPAGMDGDGLPIGIQVIGPYLEDYTSIRFAGLMEQAGIVGFTPPPGFV